MAGGSAVVCLALLQPLHGLAMLGIIADVIHWIGEEELSEYLRVIDWTPLALTASAAKCGACQVWQH